MSERYITPELFCFFPPLIGPKARLMLRYPDGQREQISLSSKAKLLVSKHHISLHFKAIYQYFGECAFLLCWQTRSLLA